MADRAAGGAIQTCTILLVEDSPSDAYLTRQAFDALPAPIDLHHVENGAECLAFLRKSPPFASAPTPDLVLLDLNMPVMNGLAVLGEIGADPRLRSTPVVVLSTSRAEPDVAAAYDRRCNAYVVKPLDFALFGQAIDGIWRHWFEVATLPRPA